SSGGGSSGAAPGSIGSVQTNSQTGKDYYANNVHPMLSATCGGCHDAAGPGPHWITKADAGASYTMLFALGYVSTSSRILLKGPDGGVTTNVLNDQQKATFTTWVNMELKDDSAKGKAPPNVLATISGCIDQAKFNAIGLGNMRTIQRTNNNNVNKVAN